MNSLVVLDGGYASRADFTEAGGQLTPTLKVRRYVVMEQYAAQIAALYEIPLPGVRPRRPRFPARSAAA